MACFAVAVTLTPARASAQLAYADPETQEVCRRALARPLPPPPPGALTDTQLARCDVTGLYYGLGQPVDLSAALQCGWYQLAHPDDDRGDPFAGPGVLSMIYANGDGVPRDLDLATRFVCAIEGAAPAELDGRIAHLQSIRDALSADAGARDSYFDLCDDATSGRSAGSCVEIETRRRDANRDAEIERIVRTLPPVARRRIAGLREAESRFDGMRAGNEVDASGTLREVFALREEAILADQFVINLQRFTRGTIPAVSAADLARLEHQLANMLDRVRHAPEDQWREMTIRSGGILETQQAYAALVDAWLAFVPLANPSVAPAAVRAQLIRLRLHQLHSLLRVGTASTFQLPVRVHEDAALGSVGTPS